MKNRVKLGKDRRQPKHQINIFGFKVRQNPQGSYVLHIRRKTIKHFEVFHSLEAAEAKCRQLHQEKIQHGLMAFSLSIKDREMANEAISKLDGRASLLEAVNFWITHHPNNSGVTVRNLVDSYLADMTRRNRRLHTLGDARRRLYRFCSEFGDLSAATINEADIIGWLVAKGGKPANSNNYRKHLFAAFEFGVRHGITPLNPVDKVERASVDKKLPIHWSHTRISQLLSTAEVVYPRLLPYLAIMSFAGLRPNEASRLNWSNVLLSEKIIRVLPDTSKTRTARIVEISDNLSKWLEPHNQATGPIAPSAIMITRWRTRIAAASTIGGHVLERIKKGSKLKGTKAKALGFCWSAVIQEAKAAEPLWHQDVLRHTYATFWLAANHDINRLSQLMGNSPKIINAYYKGLATQREASLFWNIYPSFYRSRPTEAEACDCGEVYA